MLQRNLDATTNAVEYYRPTYHVRAYDLSGLSTLIRGSVIMFALVSKVQLN